MHRSVKPFTLSVAFRVVWGRSALLNAVYGAKFFDEVALEITALITVDPFGDAIPEEPVVHKYLGNGGSLLVLACHRLRKLGEDVRHHQDILDVPHSRFQDREINCQLLQWLLCSE